MTMEGHVPTPSLWLYDVAPDEDRDCVVGSKLEEYAAAIAVEGRLLVARAAGDGIVYVYSVRSSCDAGAAPSEEPSAEFANSSCRLVIRYSLGVGAFGSPGEGRIWVGSKEVCHPLGQLSFVPGKEHELVFFQRGSKKLLSVHLPSSEAAGLVGSGAPLPRTSDGSLASSGTPVCSLGSCPERVSCLAVSRDGEAVAVVDEGGNIRVWSLIDGQMTLDMSGASWAKNLKTAGRPLITTLAFIGKDLLSGACWDGVVRIWGCHRPPHLHLVDSLTTLERSPLDGLAVHWQDPFDSGGNEPGDAVVAAGAANGMLHVWKSSSDRGWQLAFVADHAEREGPLAHLTFSKCGNLLATAADHCLPRPGEDVVEVEGDSCGSGDGEETPLIRVYETSRWACFTAHTSPMAMLIAIRFVDRSLLLTGEGCLQGGALGHGDTGQVLLLFFALGPPHVIWNPEKAAAPGRPRTAPAQPPTAIGRKPSPLCGRYVSFQEDVCKDDQRAWSRGDGCKPGEGGQREQSGGGGGPGLEPSKREEGLEQNNRAGCSASGSQEPILEPTPLAIHLGRADLDGEEEGEPTPLPLPARLVKSKERTQATGQGSRNPPHSTSSQPHEPQPTVPPSTNPPVSLCHLSAPALHSTARLLIQLEQLQEQRFDSHAALQSLAAGSRPSSVRTELAGMTGGLSLGDFARLGGQTQGGVPVPGNEGLTAVEEEEGTTKVMMSRAVAKQVGSQGQAARTESLPQKQEKEKENDMDGLGQQHKRSCPQVCDVVPACWALTGKDTAQYEEISMATWSCLAAMP